MKGALAAVEISVLCGCRFINQFDTVSETLIAPIQLAVSCSELYLFPAFP